LTVADCGGGSGGGSEGVGVKMPNIYLLCA